MDPSIVHRGFRAPIVPTPEPSGSIWAAPGLIAAYVAEDLALGYHTSWPSTDGPAGPLVAVSRAPVSGFYGLTCTTDGPGGANAVDMHSASFLLPDAGRDAITASQAATAYCLLRAPTGGRPGWCVTANGILNRNAVDFEGRQASAFFNGGNGVVSTGATVGNNWRVLAYTRAGSVERNRIYLDGVDLPTSFVHIGGFSVRSTGILALQWAGSHAYTTAMGWYSEAHDAEMVAKMTARILAKYGG